MKKKTLEEVRQLFESRGFTLLSTEYIGSKFHLEYICNNGHQNKIRSEDLQQGQGCLDCSGNKKKTIEEVKQLFESKGFILLSNEYKDANSLLNYRCSKSHNAKISFDALNRGIGCAECSGKKKKTVEEVEAAFKFRGYTLLSIEYKNVNSPLMYLCDKGHQTKISFADLKTGYGCAKCAGNKKKTIEEVRELFDSKNFTLLSNTYKNANYPLDYLCNQGHQTKISYATLTQGQGCSSCAKSGFDPSKAAILYYLRFQFEGNFYYKIGITNNTTSKRFQKEKTPYTVIKETVFPLGKDAYEQEQAILKEFSQWQYKGKPFLVSGNTELFIKDVLYIDSSILGGIAA